MLAEIGVATRFYHIWGLRSFKLRELSGLDQFNLLRMGKVLPFNIDMKAVRKEISLKDYYCMYKDFKSYLDQDLGIKEARIGEIQKRNMYHRLIFKRYPVSV